MTRRKLPRFDACLEMMRQTGDPQQAEEAFQAVREHASAFVDELIGAYQSELDQGTKRWLLELIGEARDPKTLEFLVEQLRCPDESLRYWAISGLKLLNTREARKAIYECEQQTRK